MVSLWLETVWQNVDVGSCQFEAPDSGPYQIAVMASLKKDQLDDVVDSGFGNSFDHQPPSSSSLQNLGHPPVQQLEQLTLEAPTTSSCPFGKQDEDGDTLLHIALKNRQEDDACKIIEVMSSEDLELRNNDGMTPLLLAATGRLISPLRLLIERNVAVDCEELKERNNIAHIATKRGYHDVIEAIFTGSELMTRETYDSLAKLLESNNESGLTPFHIAVVEKNLESCRLLKLIGANVDAQDTLAGYTSLHHAVRTNDAQFVKDFIAVCEPSLEVSSYEGLTPYMLVDINKAHAVKQVLIERGALQISPETFDDEDM
eukprot:Seg2988.3 transcript_id=Seg2988.3/GoldUCD/mRNA.D3Y31 product="Nuclear factor NF-kappa-B p105 subunit" protein_id=Seg2988.3/GoldUCD/D3Y31